MLLAFYWYIVLSFPHFFEYSFCEIINRKYSVQRFGHSSIFRRPSPAPLIRSPVLFSTPGDLLFFSDFSDFIVFSISDLGVCGSESSSKSISYFMMTSFVSVPCCSQYYFHLSATSALFLMIFSSMPTITFVPGRQDLVRVLFNLIDFLLLLTHGKVSFWGGGGGSCHSAVYYMYMHYWDMHTAEGCAWVLAKTGGYYTRMRRNCQYLCTAARYPVDSLTPSSHAPSKTSDAVLR